MDKNAFLIGLSESERTEFGSVEFSQQSVHDLSEDWASREQLIEGLEAPAQAALDELDQEFFAYPA